MKTKIFLNGVLVILAMALAFIWATAPAHANTEVGLFFASKHPEDKEYNESNPGIYLIHNSYTVGVFKNSYYNTTYIVGLTSDPMDIGPTKATIGYGLIHGYGWDGGYADADKYGVKTLAYILPTLSYGRLNIHYIGSGVAFSVKVVF